MGYEDKLYNAKNIIGYTGKLDDNPTVYFLEPAGSSPRRFGHITQSHWLWLNVGREKVHLATNYKYGNEIIDGETVFRETADGFKHTSRNKFTETPPTHDSLLASITRFPEMKEVYDDRYYGIVQAHLGNDNMSDDDLDKVLSHCFISQRRPRGQ